MEVVFSPGGSIGGNPHFKVVSVEYRTVVDDTHIHTGIPVGIRILRIVSGSRVDGFLVAVPDESRLAVDHIIVVEELLGNACASPPSAISAISASDIVDRELMAARRCEVLAIYYLAVRGSAVLVEQFLVVVEEGVLCVGLYELLGSVISLVPL